MHRFIQNRLWTFIFALSIAIASCVVLAPVAGAEDPVSDPSMVPIGDTAGDPDGLSGGGNRIMRGTYNRGSMGIGRTTAGDGGSMTSGWMWRLYVVWNGLRSYTIRF